MSVERRYSHKAANINAAALKKLERFILDNVDGNEVKTVDEMPLSSAARDEMLRDRRAKGISAQQIENYERQAGAFLGAVGDLPLIQYTPRHGVEFLEAVQARKGIRSTTVVGYMNGASAVFAHAVKTGILRDNPLAKVEYQATDDESEGGVDNWCDIDHDTATTIIDAVLSRPPRGSGRPIRRGSNEAWACAVGLARFGGLRASEIRALRIDKLDLEGKTKQSEGRPCIFVRNRKTYARRKDAKEYRTVPAGPYLAGLIQAAIATSGDSTYVIGRTLIGTANTMKDHSHLFRLAGIDRIPAFFQNCRRSRAQELAKAGMPTKAHCDIMGHSERVALRFYLRTDGDMLDVAVSIEPGGKQARLQLVG